MSRPEFSRPERIDTFGEGERTIAISATPGENAALATRFGLIAIETLTASFRVRREAGGLVARGTVAAVVTQACSVTDEPIAATVAEEVALRFIAGDAPATEEIELSADTLDTMVFDGGAIDLGEVAAETMALALDPFPRGPNAAAALRAAGVISEEEARPPGALAGLKAAIEKRQS